MFPLVLDSWQDAPAQTKIHKIGETHLQLCLIFVLMDQPQELIEMYGESKPSFTA